MIFWGHAHRINLLNHYHNHMGWYAGDGHKKWYKDHGLCYKVDRQRADGCFACDRYHIRFFARNGFRDNQYGYYRMGSPHHDIVVFNPSCGIHVGIQFDYVRDYIVNRFFRIAHHAHHPMYTQFGSPYYHPRCFGGSDFVDGKMARVYIPNCADCEQSCGGPGCGNGGGDDCPGPQCQNVKQDSISDLTDNPSFYTHPYIIELRENMQNGIAHFPAVDDGFVEIHGKRFITSSAGKTTVQPFRLVIGKDHIQKQEFTAKGTLRSVIDVQGNTITLVNVDEEPVQFPIVYMNPSMLMSARRSLLDNEFFQPFRLTKRKDIYGYEETSQTIVFVFHNIEWKLDARSYLPKSLTFLNENDSDVKHIMYIYEGIQVRKRFSGYDIEQADVYESQTIFDAQGWRGHVPWQTYYAGDTIGTYTLHEVDFIERRKTTPAKVTVWRYCQKGGKECDGSVMVVEFLKTEDRDAVRALLAEHHEEGMLVKFFGDTMVRIDFPEDILKNVHLEDLHIIRAGGGQ